MTGESVLELLEALGQVMLSLASGFFTETDLGMPLFFPFSP